MSVGIMASSVVLASGVDVLLEPFNNYTFAPWVTTSSPPIVAGRTGTGAQMIGVSDRADYNLSVPAQSAVVLVGFACRVATLTAVQNLVNFRSDAGTSSYGTVSVSPAGIISATDSGGIPAVQSTSGLITTNTWFYVEVRYVCGDAPNGAATLRVNGTQIGAVTGIDTRPGSGKTVYDQIRIGPPNAGAGGTVTYDDLYITIGADAAFKGDIAIT